MYHLFWLLFVSGGRMTSRKICKLWILQLTSYDVLDREPGVMENECRVKWLLSVRDTVTCKVHPVVLGEFFRDPGDARFLSFGTGERCKAADKLTDVG